MSNYIYEKNVDSLKDNLSDDGCDIIYAKYATKNYDIHIVCCQFKDVESLEMNWMELVNNVSETIQQKLSKLIEIYNVYILFFQPDVGDSLAFSIEMNKYSSRKIVLAEEMPMDQKNLEDIINDKLFALKIETDDIGKGFTIDSKFKQCTDDITADLRAYLERESLEAFNEENKQS